MRRTSWAAIGAVSGALIGVAAASNTAALIPAVVLMAAIGIAWRLLKLPRQESVVPLAVGTLIILGRATLGAVAAPPAAAVVSGEVTAGTQHTAVVLSLG